MRLSLSLPPLLFFLEGVRKMSHLMKTCPFCKSERVTIWSNRSGVWGKCLDCDALGPFVLDGKPKDAVAKWNLRPAPTLVEVSEDGEKNLFTEKE
jgi:hypothetical protein